MTGRRLVGFGLRLIKRSSQMVCTWKGPSPWHIFRPCFPQLETRGSPLLLPKFLSLSLPENWDCYLHPTLALRSRGACWYVWCQARDL